MKSLRKIFVIIAVLSTSCSTAPKDRKTYFVLSNGARLPVYENGPDTDKIILFTHGGPGASGVINYHMPFFQELARHYKVIFWDQRGSGGARGHISKDSINLPQFVDDMDAVYQSVETRYPKKKIYVMGHSFGGLVGGAFLSKFNDKVPGSIFVAPAFNIEQVTKTMSPAMITWIEDYLVRTRLSKKDRDYWNSILNYYKKNPVVGVDSFNIHLSNTTKVDEINSNGQMCDYVKYGIAKYFIPDNVLDSLDFFSESLLILHALGASGEATRNLSTDKEFGLGKVTSPMLLFTGGLDFVVPQATSIDGFNHLNNGVSNPNSVHVLFADASHQPFFRFKNQMLQAVIEFVDSN